MAHVVGRVAWVGVVLMAAALAPSARAQDVAPVSSEAAVDVFARVVARARETGAIERVLGLHPFIMTRHGYDDDGKPLSERRFLMTYELAIDEAEQQLRLGVRVRPEAFWGQVEIDYVVGLDGRLRSMRAVTGSTVTAEVREGKLVITAVDEGATVEHAWDDAILPKIVGAFVLPMLADQGLPEAWTFRDLNPFGTVTRPIVMRTQGEGGVATWATFEGRVFDGQPRPTTRVQVGGEDAGEGAARVVRIETESEVNAKGVVVHLAASPRIPRAEYERLSPGWQEDKPR